VVRVSVFYIHYPAIVTCIHRKAALCVMSVVHEQILGVIIVQHGSSCLTNLGALYIGYAKKTAAARCGRATSALTIVLYQQRHAV
jgi:hypothetical protein